MRFNVLKKPTHLLFGGKHCHDARAQRIVLAAYALEVCGAVCRVRDLPGSVEDRLDIAMATRRDLSAALVRHWTSPITHDVGYMARRIV